MPKASKRRVQDDSEDEFEVDDAPTSIDPYLVLAIESTATEDQVKSAYRKAALTHHPDKVSEAEKESAHAKFQEIAFAYAVLSDPRRRKRYDTTGRTEDTLDLEDDDFDWSSFFRQQYQDMVTVEKIDKFSGQYKGSEEEKEHLLRAYTRHRGSMGKIYQEVMLSDPVDDEDRFHNILDKAIEAGEVEAFSTYTDETEKSRKSRVDRARKQRNKESNEAEEVHERIKNTKSANGGGKKKAVGQGATDDLAAMIQQRQKGREANFFDNLEAKYAPKGKGRAKRAADDEPPEEAFEANRKKSQSETKATEGTRPSRRRKI